MPITLIVENGTGLANANTYVSLAEATAYHAERGNTDWASFTYTDDLRSGALVRASFGLDAAYRALYSGQRLTGRTQALEWPRKDAIALFGDRANIDSNSVPREVRQAAAQAALLELASPGALASFPDRGISSVRLGPLSVTFDDLQAPQAGQDPRTLGVAAIIAPVLSPVGGDYSGGGLFARAGRG